MEKSRNGRPIRRSVQLDIEDWTKQGVAIVLCLLNDYEIRTLGVDEKLYKKVCLSSGVELVQYPIIEMSVPEENTQIHAILHKLAQSVENGQRIVIHCRGGIGRTAIIVCALLKLLAIEDNPRKAIQYVREVRDKRCVESRKQEDWVCQFFLNWNSKIEKPQ